MSYAYPGESILDRGKASGKIRSRTLCSVYENSERYAQAHDGREKAEEIG